MTNPAAPPGWYPDPAANGGQRYWDGRAWQQSAPAAPAAPTAPGGWGAPPPAAPQSYGQPTGYAQQPTAYGQAPAPYGHPGQVAPYTQMVSPKSPGIAVLISFFWPGAGHLYVEGPTTRAILLMIGTFVGLCLTLVLVGALLLLGLAIYTMIDAHKLAQNWNVARGFPPG